MMRRLRHIKILCVMVAVLVPALIFTASALAVGPTGATPNDPLMVPTGDQTIAANTTLWFYFDYVTEKLGGRGGPGGGPGGGGPPPGGGPGGPSGGGSLGSRVPANVTLDAGGVGSLAFGIYTPALAADWINGLTVDPVGRGTPYTDTSNGQITHDLYWSGGFNTTGRYYVAVTNNNATPVTLRLTVTGDTVTLYPVTPAATATPDIVFPLTETPVPTGTIQGKILFETATGGEIYTVNGDGTDLKLITHGIDPSWSPDGKLITFARWDNTNPGVFVANADGSNERLVFATNKARWPQISADGKYVTFSRDKTQVENKVVWNLGVVDLATGKLTEPQCSQLSYLPNWSADGTKIYYTDPDRVIMAANVTTGPATLVGPSASYYDSASNMARPLVNWPPIQSTTLSPDGKQFVFSMKAHDRWEINTMSIYGGAQNGVTGPDDAYYLTGKVVHNVAPTWSPDSAQILFLSDRNGKWEFFVMKADGSGVIQVLKNVTDKLDINFGYENERIVDWSQ